MTNQADAQQRCIALEQVIERQNKRIYELESQLALKVNVMAAPLKGKPVRFARFDGQLLPVASDVLRVVAPHPDDGEFLAAPGATTRLIRLGLARREIKVVLRIELADAYGMSTMSVCDAFGMARTAHSLAFLTVPAITFLNTKFRGFRQWYLNAANQFKGDAS